jgi:FkbM family methyltransferase
MEQRSAARIETVTITQYGKSYQINNPGEGRVGSKLSMGTPYEQKLLVDIYQHDLTGSAFDIGAHIGNHTLYLAAVCGLKVYAWEPYPDSLKQLEANVALNDFDVEVFDWAAGDEVGKGRFTPGMWIEFDPSRQGAKLQLQRGEVPVYPIDDMLDVADLAVVKVDVEGMESRVLAGMVRHLARSHPLVYAETHDVAAYESIRAVLEPIGYKMTRGIHMGSPQHRWEVV